MNPAPDLRPRLLLAGLASRQTFSSQRYNQTMEQQTYSLLKTMTYMIMTSEQLRTLRMCVFQPS